MKYFEDDMDELFNKAGRQYPLKTEPKNWEAVRSALAPEDVAPAITQRKRGLKRFIPFLLLLLVPALYIFNENGPADVKNDPVRTNAAEVRDQKAAEPPGSLQTPQTGSLNDLRNGSGEPEIAEAPGTEAAGGITGDQKSGNKEHVLSYVPPIKRSLNNAQEEESGDVKGGLSDPPKAGKLTRSTDIQNDPAGWNDFPPLDAGSLQVNEPSGQVSLLTPLRSFGPENGSSSVPNSDKKDRHKRTFYYGVILGPDFSTIKGQEIKNAGYSLGLLAGYRFSRHWSVEAGAIWARKKYYTDGKYFSKTGGQIPSYVNLHWLDGGCDMFEFPVLVRYNLSAVKNTFFATAGVTSYMMREEEYEYAADAGPGNNYYEGYRSYKRSGDHLFANLQVTAGYNLKLSSKLNIRIEPYLKMPIRKIGIGKMPITSTGLYLGIMKDIR